MKNFLLSVSILTSLALSSPFAMAIQKCQDADGNWHYGDVAVAECQNSLITTLNERGYVSEVWPPPKTEEELKADEDQLAEEEQLKFEQEERSRILSIYERAEDIDRQRDNQLITVQGNIDVHEAYLRNMELRIERFESQKTELTSERRIEALQNEIDQAKVRVENSEKELVSLMQQKTDIEKKFDSEKEIYLKYTSADES